MANQGEVTLERNGKQYGATFTVSGPMLHVKTHTETRAVELNGEDPETVTRRVLNEIVDAQPRAG